ncbi:MAG: chalcone isomerase family protein [Gemmatimonadota bacterium]|nr:chalcone isomerase family protein [Gemmatimonadota bacterium]
MIAILLLAVAVHGAEVVEPNTNIAFPTELQTPVGVQRLTGTGVRVRTVFKVKVYAFGLYVDGDGARAALAPWRGKSAAELASDASLYDELLKGSFPMTMRLEMARDVGAHQMAEAFDGALAPRVAQAAQRGVPGGAEALGRFRALFTSELRSGSELLFTWAPGDKLLVSIGGRQVGEIENRALCWALFDVYLGPKPISPEGKTSVVARLPELIAS